MQSPTVPEHSRLELIDGPLPLQEWIGTLTPEWMASTTRQIVADYEQTLLAEVQARTAAAVRWQAHGPSRWAEQQERAGFLQARRQQAALQPAYDAVIHAYAMYCAAYPMKYRVVPR